MRGGGCIPALRSSPRGRPRPAPSHAAMLDFDIFIRPEDLAPVVDRDFHVGRAHRAQRRGAWPPRGTAWFQHVEGVVHRVTAVLAGRLQEDPPHHREHRRRVQLGHSARHVAQGVHLAALPSRAREHLRQRTAQPVVGVGDDHMHAVRPPPQTPNT